MLNTPFNYTGSKYKILDQLYENLPISSSYAYVYDLFLGGGSFSINYPEDKILVCNDVIKSLIDFYIELQSKSYEEIITKLNNWIIEKDNKNKFYEYRDIYNNLLERDPYLFFNLIISSTNNFMRFNKKFNYNASFGERTITDSIFKKLEGYHNKIHSSTNFNFCSNSFEEILIRDNSFVYLDPPYLLTKAGYNCYWSEELDDKLISLINELDERNIKFMLSNILNYNGKEYKHYKFLKQFNIKEISIDYNKVSKKGTKLIKEVIIMNY